MTHLMAVPRRHRDTEKSTMQRFPREALPRGALYARITPAT
jgi:hypothetical protein